MDRDRTEGGATVKLEHGTPREIEGESMRIIGRELEAMGIVLPAAVRRW